MQFSKTLLGIRILDLTNNLPGPFASQLLGDLGADVIKVESLEGDNVRKYPPFINNDSQIFVLLNRNKRSISLNLKSSDGLRIFYKLVELSDVVLESFRPGTTKRLKIDYDKLKSINPTLIYCSITGYGDQDCRSGHDINYVAASGILGITGPQEQPTPIGVPIGDIGAGALPAVIAILSALLQPKNESKYINISITDHLIPWLSIVASTFLASINEPEREEHALSGYQPWYRLYQTKDKRHISFAPLEAKFWKNFCEAINKPELISKQFDFDLLNNTLPNIFLQKTYSEWDKWFEENDIPGIGVNSVKEALENKIRKISIKSHDYYQIIKSPFLDDSFVPNIKPPPQLGEHTQEILQEIGITDDLSILKKNTVINMPD